MADAALQTFGELSDTEEVVRKAERALRNRLTELANGKLRAFVAHWLARPSLPADSVYRLRWLAEHHLPGMAGSAELHNWLRLIRAHCVVQKLDAVGSLQREIELFQAKKRAALQRLYDAINARTDIMRAGFAAWLEERNVRPLRELPGGPAALGVVGALASVASSIVEHSEPAGFVVRKPDAESFEERLGNGVWHICWADSICAAYERLRSAHDVIVERVKQRYLSADARYLVDTVLPMAGAVNIGVVRPELVSVTITEFVPDRDVERRLQQHDRVHEPSTASRFMHMAESVPRLDYHEVAYRRVWHQELVPELRVEGVLREPDADGCAFLAYPGGTCLDTLDVAALTAEVPE